jgi:tRNA pseudouridine38-40 synthase
MPKRLKLVIAYNGAEFAGWQSQLHRKTIQDQLEEAFRRIVGIHVRVHGAGRTDAGVHAFAQCAHVDLPDRRLEAIDYVAALNAILPPGIRVLRTQYVSPDFHARFSAKGKVYRYRIWAGPILPPHEFQRAWHVTTPLDFDVLKKAAMRFLGRHDFQAFAAKRGKSDRSNKQRPGDAVGTTRTIRSVRVRRSGRFITIEFDGDGFLYKMVRLMVGAIVNAARGKISVADIGEWLNCGATNGRRLVAPAEGLFLIRVWY